MTIKPIDNRLTDMQEKAAAAEKKELERQRKEMYEKQKLERKEERAKYREKVFG